MKIRLFFFNFLICSLSLRTFAQSEGFMVSQNTTPPLPVTQISVTQPGSTNPSTLPIPSNNAAQTTPNGQISETAPAQTNNSKPSNSTPAAGVGATSTAEVLAQRTYEYPSYCTEDLYPEEEARSEKLKEKRLSFLEKKINELKESSKKEDFNKVVYLYLDEMFLQKKSASYIESEFKKLFLYINEEIQIYGSALIEKRRRNFAAAQKILLKYLETHSKNIKNTELIARVYQKQKNYVEAANAFEDLRKFNPKKDYLLELCENSALNNDHESTKSYCRQLKTKHPKNEKGSIYLGISERDRENYKKAVSFFKESVKLKPTEFGYTCLGESLVLDKKLDEATEAFLQSVKIAPYSKRAQLGLALNYVEKKEYKKALEHFKASCKLGEKPLRNFSIILQLLKDTKNPVHEDYFKLVQECQQMKAPLVE